MDDELDLDEIEAHWEYARDFPDSGSGDVFELIAKCRRLRATLAGIRRWAHNIGEGDPYEC